MLHVLDISVDVEERTGLTVRIYDLMNEAVGDADGNSQNRFSVTIQLPRMQTYSN
jgi:hypothetical protein